MTRRRCLEVTLYLAIAQLLLTVSAVYFMRSAHPEHNRDIDQRGLLSIDYSATANESIINLDVLSAISELPEDGDSQEATVFDFDEYSANLDKYRMFKTKMFTVTGNEWSTLSRDRKVCLGAQTSIDRSYWVIDMAKHWSGPISLALFVPDVEYHVSKIYIRYMRRCFPSVARQVSFHFTFPTSHPVKESDLLRDVDESELSCEEPRAVIKKLMKARTPEMLKWRESFAYPQNLLRNRAKSGCQTEFTFIPDVDMIPTKGLDLDLDVFLRNETQSACKKCAFVVPTYEIADSVVETPQSKTELLALVQQKKARRFHQVVYKLNQLSSDLDKWEKMPQATEFGRAYSIKQYRFKYEPLYVARADTPPFDERFIGFGMTRNTQVYEMYVAGYEFIVLNNAFTNHRGFQTIKNRPKWRAKQQEANNKKVDEFALELIARYGKDPYDMKTKLKQYNFKNIHVGYGSSKKSSEEKKAKKT